MAATIKMNVCYTSATTSATASANNIYVLQIWSPCGLGIGPVKKVSNQDTRVQQVTSDPKMRLLSFWYVLVPNAAVLQSNWNDH